MAHETHVYRIGDKTYQLTVGSLNEPVTVDDKTGLDLRVGMPNPKGSDPAPVTGLDQTLKVEVAAGAKKRTFNIQPAFGTPGSYRTSFYPTVQTTLSYRIFGTINDVPMDVTFTCNPAGHPRTPDDANESKVTDQVTRLSKRGAFGCPGAKADLGFPEKASSSYELQSRIAELNEELADTRSNARMMGIAGIVLGLLGLGVGAAAWVTSRRASSVSDKRQPR
jgi:hypothetical protein